MKLSVIVPSIRPGNLKRLYESVKNAFCGEFEFIVIGPYALPKYFADKENVVYIHDLGSPVRAMQIGICEAKGDFVLWGMADDGYLYPAIVDFALTELENADPRSVYIGKYYEGSENPFMNSRKYYQINTHDGSRSRFIPQDCLMFMVGVIPRQLLLETGGLDCTLFEALPMAFNDISVRMSNMGVNFIFRDAIMFRCSHMPGHLGDHGPIHDAQVDFDQPKFLRIYNDQASIDRKEIPIDNWKQAPARWERRFGRA